jgi:hypothetical protein
MISSLPATQRIQSMGPVVRGDDRMALDHVRDLFPLGGGERIADRPRDDE